MTISRLFKSIIGTSLLCGALLFAPQAAQARVFVSVGFAPPPIPVYEQPIWPGDGYIWTPGYWAYTDDGYEWVDGAWVVAPYTGALWTPGYWGYDNSSYFWNAGYWGPSVGYYGGINYGFGYFGVGFYGGYWNHGAFFCNREYNRFGGNFRGHNFYSERVGHYDGRPGGTSFARGGFDANRGGSFNHGGSFARPVGDRGGENGGRAFAGGVNVNRGGNFNTGGSFARGTNNGFVQNGGDRQIATTGRAPYNGSPTTRTGPDNGGSFARGAGNGGYNPSAGTRGGVNQPNQARPVAPTRSFGGNGNFTSNLRPAQGGFQGNQGNAGRSFSAPQQRSFQGGGGARPSSGGGFQGGGGARPSSGGGFQGGGGGGFHGGGSGGSHGGGHR